MDIQDTTRTYETPEGVTLEFRVAGPVPRALALAFDTAIRFGIYYVSAIVLTTLGALGFSLFLIWMFLLEWFYPVFFEVVWNGATPGKKALGLKVVNDNGTPVGWGSSTIRNLLRAADFFPLFYGFGLTAMLLNRDFKRLGDMAAGTLVIYRPKSGQTLNIPATPPVPPPLPLSLTEQRAILDFAERGQWLSTERSEELATILQPITGAEGNNGMQLLYGYANHLHGTEAPSTDGDKQ